MNKIVILLVTFFGIYNGFAQNPAGKPAADSMIIITSRSIATAIQKQTASVKIFPNPVKNKAELDLKGFEAGLVQLQLTDINGKKLRDDERLLVSGTETMVLMFALQPGIYFLLLKQKDIVIKKKMLVQ
jgi:hypothetical protein